MDDRIKTTIRLDQDVMEALRERAKKDHRSVANMIQCLLRDALEVKK